MSERLTEYKAKRNFNKTKEPMGTIKDVDGGLKYAIQHHIARRDHYDLRLEWKGTLLSWAIPKGPSYDTCEKRLAIKVEDHPIEYRNYEGTIPKGEYGGGVVMLWDEGYWEPYGDVDQGLMRGTLKFTIEGIRLKGKWALLRIKNNEDDDKDNWLLIKEKDEYAKDEDGISQYIKSVRTDRTMDEIAEGAEKKNLINPYNHTSVQLAKMASAIPKDDDYLYELKYDGYRILAYIENNNVRLVTRNDNDYTKQFYKVSSSLITMAQGRAMVLDGEMCVTDDNGRTDFQKVQNYVKSRGGDNLVYFVFDLLALDGEDLRGLPLIDRKNKLIEIMDNPPYNVYYSRHVEGRGKESFIAACQANMEGIIGKKAHSVYRGERNNDWIKLKCDNREEFIIGGYTLSDKKSSGISSILLGVYDNHELIYVGRAGTGFTQSVINNLEKKFKSIVDKSPFKKPIKPSQNEKIFYLKPVYVAEIKFTEITNDNILRQASYKGLREDKNPKDVTMDILKKELSSDKTSNINNSDKDISDKDIIVSNNANINGHNDKQNLELDSNASIVGNANIKGHNYDKQNIDVSNNTAIDGNKEMSKTEINKINIKITNPDKVIINQPLVTKSDIINYYKAVGERMLPYINHRILSVVRCPKGVTEPCFYKKHPAPNSKGIVTIHLKEDTDKSGEYFYIENAEGLLYEAQMGTIEFHTWGSRVESLETPDIMVFDLDPDEGMDLDRVRQGVHDLKSILTDLSIKSYLKTSGGKGYHIVAPFIAGCKWADFNSFARRIAEVMESKWPELYTSNMRKLNRKNKIFIDWIRNGRGATSIAPYSLRAREGAGVSMPIAWEELNSIAPADINITNALKRLNKADPWEDFFNCTQQLQ